MNKMLNEAVATVESHITEKLKGASGYVGLPLAERRKAAKEIVLKSFMRVLLREAESNSAFDL